MKNKKIYAILAVLTVVLGGSAIAAYILSSQNTVTAMVGSDGQTILEFQVSNQDMGFINTSEGVVIKNITNTLNNGNGDLNVTLTLETTIDDFVDDCNATGDTQTSLLVDGVEKANGDNLILSSGSHEFVTVIESVAHSCPQNVTINTLLVEN